MNSETAGALFQNSVRMDLKRLPVGAFDHLQGAEDRKGIGVCLEWYPADGESYSYKPPGADIIKGLIDMNFIWSIPALHKGVYYYILTEYGLSAWSYLNENKRWVAKYEKLKRRMLKSFDSFRHAMHKNTELDPNVGLDCIRRFKRILEYNDWMPEDSPPTLKSIKSAVWALGYFKPEVAPHIGCHYDGDVIMYWHSGNNEIIISCKRDGSVTWLLKYYMKGKKYVFSDDILSDKVVKDHEVHFNHIKSLLMVRSKNGIKQ